MFNLLPEQEKKVLRKEYRRRRLIVFLGSFIALGVIAIMMLIPSYILSYAKKHIATIEHESVARAYSDQVSSSINDIVHARNLLTLIGPESTTTESSALIKAIVDARPAGIKVVTISLQNEQKALQVQGISATREALRGFTTALAGAGFFDNVDVPISSFARDADIPFTITMNIHQVKAIKP